MKLGTRPATVIEPGEFRRPASGPVWTSKESGLPLQGLPAWQSNGSADRAHVLRTKPYSLEVLPPKANGELARIHVVGVFALHATEDPAGSIGASITVGEDRDPLLKLNLISGRHYTEATNPQAVERLTGDGASVETVGRCDLGNSTVRVDLLTIDVPGGSSLAPIRFRDLGTPASFMVFDVLYEYSPTATCPFKSRSGGVALGELAAVVRVGDRVRLRRALDQLQAAVLSTPDLDEAKGEALTFIAVVTAATLEMGGSRAMHRVQLDAARKLDRITDREDIVTETRCIVENLATPLSPNALSPSALLVDKALGILNRNFAKEITDESVADQLGLSTSHFRFLFREVTGQAFHKYLIALRLERARKLLMEANMPVSEVAAAVGFNGLAHFSRAFTQRFSVSPTNLRRSAAGISE
jgi:AraC-like DNA-binding protein